MWEKQTNGLYGQQCQQLFRARPEIQAKSVGIVARPRKLDRLAHKTAFEWVTSADRARASARFLSLQAVNFQSRRHVWERRPSACAAKQANLVSARRAADWSHKFPPFSPRISKKKGATQAKSRARSRCGNAARESLRGCAPFRVDLQWSLRLPGAERTQGGVRALSRKTQLDSLTLGVMLRADD